MPAGVAGGFMQGTAQGFETGQFDILRGQLLRELNSARQDLQGNQNDKESQNPVISALGGFSNAPMTKPGKQQPASGATGRNAIMSLLLRAILGG